MYGLTATGLFDSTKNTSPEGIAEHESQLRKKADIGFSDAQNELDVLLYKRAQTGNGILTMPLLGLTKPALKNTPSHK